MEITVEPAHTVAPTVVVPFAGYVYENSIVNTVVFNLAQTELLQLLVSDNDLVTPSFCVHFIKHSYDQEFSKKYWENLI